ncbi:serine/threonine protein kinase, CMGC, dual-specificity [Massospora cicadina]|nr:serine/threonine protein kinase, CMGC, dual-specificity [Massospora cicadina]
MSKVVPKPSVLVGCPRPLQISLAASRFAWLPPLNYFSQQVSNVNTSRGTVLQTKTNLASVSCTKPVPNNTRLSQPVYGLLAKPTLASNTCQPSSKLSATPRAGNSRVPTTALKTPLAPKSLAGSMPPLKAQFGSSRTSTCVNSKSRNHGDQAGEDLLPFSKKLSESSFSATSNLTSHVSASTHSRPAIGKRMNSGASRSGDSISTSFTPKPSSSSRGLKSNAIDSSIPTPLKASAVNNVTSHPLGSSRPSLPQKHYAEFAPSSTRLKSASFSTNAKSTAKLTSASGTAIKGLPTQPIVCPSKLVTDTKSCTSKVSRLSTSTASRGSLKAAPEAKHKPRPKLSAVDISHAISLEGHPDPYGTDKLAKKSSFSGIYTPRAIPKELSQIPSPPTSSQPKRLTMSRVLRRNYRATSATSMSTYYSEPLLPEAEVLKTFGAKLTAYERKEILEYPRVYYFGANSKKLPTRDSELPTFSTSEGDLIFNLSDHLAYRYEIQKSLGKGSFGQVLRAYDYKVGREVAIKVIRNSERFHRQALTEIQLLEALARWDRDGSHNVLHILENFIFRGHLCIVTELYGINLYEYIKQNQFAGFRTTTVRNFAVQILKCLSLLSAHGVIHCDLKPENVLLAGPNNSQLKVIDFGSSCFASQRIYTYIQSRFYRSPEVILELPYGPAIDMWSFGCILAELSNGHPIFPGETEAEQMACILEVLGHPDPALLAKSKRRYSYFDVSGNPRPTLSPRRCRVVGSKPLAHILKDADEQYIDFVARCLEFDPEKRMTPAQALGHPWITGLPSSAASASPVHPRRRVTDMAIIRQKLLQKNTPYGGSDVEAADFCTSVFLYIPWPAEWPLKGKLA